MKPETTFQQRQQQFELAEQTAQRRYNQLAFWRIAWFIGIVIASWLLNQYNQTNAAIAAVFVGLLVFAWMLKKHQAIRRERDLSHHLDFVNQDEAARLNRQYLRPETGEEFLKLTHAYAGDLDIFGKHSLFRLLNRTHTHEGTKRLADWLLNAAPPELIFLRQQAVAELVPQLDWRQQLEALAYLNEKINQSPTSLKKWVNGQTSLPLYLNFLRFILPILTLGLFIGWLNGLLSGWLVLIALGIHGFVLSQVSEQAKLISEQTIEITEALKTFRDMFLHTELVEGSSPLILAVRESLQAETKPASGAIARLARLVENFNFRRNPYFYLFVALPSLWDIHYLHALNQWRTQHRKQLAGWFDALAEAEALTSLAGFAYAHPTYVTPEVVENKIPTLEATAVSHPLLPPNRSVANSLTLKGSGQTVLITGSNMSGKSTFLRTIGINVVLALTGSVVSAQWFTCSPMRVFTSMRTQDSLEESTSSFYVELKRLKTLIDLTQAEATDGYNWPMLYFLDEILKGTNSADRHRGAEALIRQLHRTTASGFVSTHDLELGQLTNAAEFVRNYHFQSDVQNGELHFDYTLYEGICRSFNASQLMRAIGIEMGE